MPLAASVAAGLLLGLLLPQQEALSHAAGIHGKWGTAALALLGGLLVGYVLSAMGSARGRWERAVLSGFVAWLTTSLRPALTDSHAVLSTAWLWYLPGFAAGATVRVCCAPASPEGPPDRNAGTASQQRTTPPALTRAVSVFRRHPGIVLLLGTVAIWGAGSLSHTLGVRLRRARCERNLQVLYAALERYRSEHSAYPSALVSGVVMTVRGEARISGLVPAYLADERVLLCPADPFKGIAVAALQQSVPLSYDYRPRHPQSHPGGVAPGALLQCVGNHSDDPTEVVHLRLQADGRIVPVAETAKGDVPVPVGPTRER